MWDRCTVISHKFNALFFSVGGDISEFDVCVKGGIIILRHEVSHGVGEIEIHVVIVVYFIL